MNNPMRFSALGLSFLICLVSVSRLPGARGPRQAPLSAGPELLTLELGGVLQTVSIHSRDARLPVLLFLHGGPGYSEMPYADRFQKGLERHFTVVHWDQRGTGRSYSRSIPKETMNLEQLISDTRDLVSFLKKKYKQKKVYLAGHSWGTILGARVVQRYPELFHAYVGIGQVVNAAQSERIAYEFALDRARVLQNKEAVAELGGLAPPPDYGGSLRDLEIQRKWLLRFGGAYHDPATDLECSRMFLSSPYAASLDSALLRESISFSISSLAADILKVDFIRQVPELKVPVYFLVGKSDYTTFFGLAEAYFHSLKAPKKELIWFRKSGHHPHLEEPEEFARVLVSRLGGSPVRKLN